jgi:hypothetical protein
MMYLILRDAKGQRHECMLMARDENRMRVAFRHGNDAIELTRCQDQWIQEGSGPIEVESFLAGAGPLIAPQARYLLAG